MAGVDDRRLRLVACGVCLAAGVALASQSRPSTGTVAAWATTQPLAPSSRVVSIPTAERPEPRAVSQPASPAAPSRQLARRQATPSLDLSVLPATSSFSLFVLGVSAVAFPLIAFLRKPPSTGHTLASVDMYGAVCPSSTSSIRLADAFNPQSVSRPPTPTPPPTTAPPSSPLAHPPGRLPPPRQAAAHAPAPHWDAVLRAYRAHLRRLRHQQPNVAMAAYNSEREPPDDSLDPKLVRKEQQRQALEEFAMELPPPVRRAWKQLLKQLSSLPLALWEMGVIAALSALGTFVEQGRPAEFYVANYAQQLLGVRAADVILACGFDHMYSAPLFLFLCGMLSASLAACTSTRQIPMARIAQNWKFLRSPPVYRSMPYARQVRRELASLAKSLQANGFKVTVENGALYASKGLLSRFAPIGVHASLLLIIAGSLVGILTGAKGTVMVPEGQAVMVGPALTEVGPLYRGFMPETVINVNNFRIDYNREGKVDQFYSDLSILEGVLQGKERETRRDTIYVNKPLQYQGLTVYQSNWDIVGLQVSVRPLAPGEAPAPISAEDLAKAPAYRMVPLPERGRAWGTFVPFPNQPPPTPGQRVRGVTLLAADFQQVIMYDQLGNFAGVRIPQSGRPIVVDGYELVVGKMLGATGLELKSDPGVPLVYTGYALCLVTSILSLWPYRQVWALSAEDSPLIIGARTNRDEIGFEQSMDGILRKLE